MGFGGFGSQRRGEERRPERREVWASNPERRVENASSNLIESFYVFMCAFESFYVFRTILNLKPHTQTTKCHHKREQ